MMVGSISPTNAAFEMSTTAKRLDTQFAIQQGLESQYGGLSNPKGSEDPQLMAKLQKADKKATLKLEEDKISAAVYEKLQAEQQRMKESKKGEAQNHKSFLA